MTRHVLAGRLVLPDRIVDDGVVEVRDGSLAYAGDRAGFTGDAPPARGTIAPGLIDVHTHGGGGRSVTTGSADDVRAVAAHHLARGTTTMLGSLVSAEPDDVARGVRAIREVAGEDSPILGSHLEGPFLGPGHCGAHDPAVLRAPDAGLVRGWLEDAAGTLRMLTLAPELDGAREVAELLVESGTTVAVGHTDADAAAFGAALAGPATLVTHLFNGMAPLHHRDPGPVAAALPALRSGDARVELIADGTHLADATARMVFALAPDDGVVLISDAMAAAGMSDGEYQLGPLTVDVREGVAWTRSEPPSIAGSTAHLADVLRRCVVRAGIDPVAAVRAATATPAAVLGLDDRGRLEPGLRGDLVVLDDDWRVREVLRGGDRVR